MKPFCFTLISSFAIISAVALSASGDLKRTPLLKPLVVDEVGALFRDLLNREERSIYRAGLLLLLGVAGDRSAAAIETLSIALFKKDERQRDAAALSLALLKHIPEQPGAREQIMEAIERVDSEQHFAGLPWDVYGDLDPDELRRLIEEID